MRHTDKTTRHSPASCVPSNSDAGLAEQDRRNEGRVARKTNIACDAASQAIPDRGGFVDSMAISDAMSDMEVGSCRLFDGMEQLFSGGDITRAAWQRYCRTYQAERCWQMPHDAAQGRAMAMEPPA